MSYIYIQPFAPFLAFWSDILHDLEEKWIIIRVPSFGANQELMVNMHSTNSYIREPELSQQILLHQFSLRITFAKDYTIRYY